MNLLVLCVTQMYRARIIAHTFLNMNFTYSKSLFSYSLFQMVWIRGPEPCGNIHDGTMFSGGKKGKKNLDETSLYHRLPTRKIAIGDSGYEGMPEKVTITRHGQSNELK